MSVNEPIVDLLRARIAELEAFIQRFIDVGYEFGDPTQLIDLHDEAVGLLPERRQEGYALRQYLDDEMWSSLGGVP